MMVISDKNDNVITGRDAADAEFVNDAPGTKDPDELHSRHHTYTYTVHATSPSRTTLYKLQTLICILLNIFAPTFLHHSTLLPTIHSAINYLSTTRPLIPFLKAELRISHQWYESLLWSLFRHFREIRRQKILAWTGYFNGFMFIGGNHDTSVLVVKNSWESPIKVYGKRQWVLYQLFHHLHEIYTPEVPMTLRRWLELMVFGRTLPLPGLMELARDRNGFCIGFYWRDGAGRRRFFENRGF